MNIKTYIKALQNVIISILIQSGLLLFVWNVLIPSMFTIGEAGLINYGQAILLICLVRILRYDQMALVSHQNISVIAYIKELEYVRQQQLDAMILQHQQKLQERSENKQSV